MELAAPATVSVSNLPIGLISGSANGINSISGVPAAADPAQTYVINITVKDANKTISLKANLVLNAAKPASAPLGQDIELPDAFVGFPYNATVSLAAGAAAGAPIVALPVGLNISAAGVVGGAPTAVNPSDGEYYSMVPINTAGIAANWRIKLNLHLSPIVVKLYTPCSVSLDERPTITTSISDLSSTITGLAAVPAGCTAKIAVWTVDPVRDRTQPLDYLTPHPSRALLQAANGNAVSIKAGDSVASDGSYSLQLTSSPRAGQTIVLEEKFTDSSQNAAGSIFSIPIPVHFAGDWGRVKTYFTSGILLSQDQGSFSQSSLFLSFLLDKSWALSHAVYSGKNKWPGFNTFFETRLTSVPITAQPCSTSTTGSGQCPSSSAGTGTGTGTGTGSGSTPTFNTFVTSQKTARLLVGTYVPIIAKQWTFAGVRNALFIGPLAKVGFDTPAGAINQSQAQGQSTSAGNPASPVIVPVNNSNFYNFYAYGFRFGHVALPAPQKERDSDNWTVNEAPEMNSYLDVAWGRFSNLETVLNSGDHTRLYRLSLEGLLKLPSTPLAIGFSANVAFGQETIGVRPSDVKQKAADDLRFLIGTKFDVGKITTYLTAHAF